jgi:8-oxo-dGTP pyrophosphatase MutT (NUDIX family)
MTELLHRIKVFVFQQRGPEPAYLLLRPAQGMESFWGPIQGSIGFGEKLESAIRREVLDDTGILQPLDVIDLQMPARWQLGIEDVIEWTYGFKTMPGTKNLRLDPRFAEFRWAQFSQAYPSLELETDRAAIMRLHTLLRAA